MTIPNLRIDTWHYEKSSEIWRTLIGFPDVFHVPNLSPILSSPRIALATQNAGGRRRTAEVDRSQAEGYSIGEGPAVGMLSGTPRICRWTKGLVNIHKTTEDPPFYSWINQLFNDLSKWAIFYVANCESFYQRLIADMFHMGCLPSNFHRIWWSDFVLLVLNVGNEGMIHWLTIKNHPSNPQQPIHSLLSTSNLLISIPPPNSDKYFDVVGQFSWLIDVDSKAPFLDDPVWT